MLLAACSLGMQAQFSGQGSGTEKDPYQITNADQLFDVRNDLTACYKVMNDIDLATWIQEDNPRQGWNPIGTKATPFTGWFDGNGKSIKGLYINKANVDCVGLFGYIKGATIKNIALLNPIVTGRNGVGAIVGGGCSTQYYCISDNACYGGKIVGSSAVGGIAGIISDVDESSTNICYLQGNYSSSVIEGDNSCGGIVGEIRGYNQSYNSAYTHINSHCYPYIYDNHFAGKVSANSMVGGIAGTELNPDTKWYYGTNLQMQTKKNLVRGIIIGKEDTNGILGKSESYRAADLFELSDNICAADTVSGISPKRIFSEAYPNNYALATTVVIMNGRSVEVDDDDYNGSGLGVKTLMRKNTYVGFGFDFNTQWAITDGESYPYNIRQSAPGRITEFLAGSRGKISGTAEGTGAVFVFIDDDMYESYIVDGQWTVTLPNITEGTEACVAVATDGLMPSLFVKARAEKVEVTPSKTSGDANGDGIIDSADVTAIINYILGRPSASFNKANADINGDGEILIDDAVNTVQMIMNAQ